MRTLKFVLLLIFQWNKIEQILGPPFGRQAVMNRGDAPAPRDPFGSTVLRGYDGIIFEVLSFV